MDFVTINVKTADHEDRSSVSEIGIAVVRDSRIEFHQSWLVRPKDNYYDEVSLCFSKVTPEMTANEPSFKDVWSKVRPYLENKTVVARFAPNDMYVIKEALGNDNIEFSEFKFYSLHSIIKCTIQYLPTSGLYDACRHFNLCDDEPRRAGEDAILSAKVLLEIAKKEVIDDVDELYTKYRYVAGGFSKTDGFKAQYRKKLA